MAGLIESQRTILEELDVIELETSKRFRKYPSIYPDEPKSTITTSRPILKRSQKEIELQQHELKLFSDKYKKQCRTILHHHDSDREMIHGELQELQDHKHTFESFDRQLNEIKEKYSNSVEVTAAENINNVYSMFSSVLFKSGDDDRINEDDNENVKRIRKDGKVKVKVKRSCISSVVASHIDLDTLFSSEEAYGKYLDLVSLYETYKASFHKELSYLEFLRSFDDYKSLTKYKSTPAYAKYLNDTIDYLVGFLERSEPLRDTKKLLENAKAEYKPAIQESADGVEKEGGEVYCKACQKIFTKLSVYQGHLSGKKHNKNQKQLEETNSTASSPAPESRNDIGYQEYLISVLNEVVSEYRKATILNTERKTAMTERERMIENTTVEGDDSEYTTVNDSSSDGSDESSSDEDDIENYKNLPLGPDGRPIPHWLYKHQGLHKTYECEICGRITYKGRIAFEKHFSGSKHQYGLKCLGVPDELIVNFKNITKIEEAQDLWKKIKRENRIREGDVENAIEVEDAEGNVMSEKDYLDLKKQGLL
ncbi:uncharacterized protein RJT20DRAFT_4384 [Scheffersomyces xylosifermentans]|uniref:uncharacterized protein n=1 Tax=Scheffersomyces xylosifermentans TaxID=1304137 RepID=UPI00315D3CA3